MLARLSPDTNRCFRGLVLIPRVGTVALESPNLFSKLPGYEGRPEVALLDIWVRIRKPSSSSSDLSVTS